MKHKLTEVFDLQRFHHNKRLDALILKTRTRYNREISDDDLTFVNAAGDIEHNPRKPFLKEENADG